MNVGELVLVGVTVLLQDLRELGVTDGVVVGVRRDGVILW